MWINYRIQILWMDNHFKDGPPKCAQTLPMATMWGQSLAHGSVGDTIHIQTMAAKEGSWPSQRRKNLSWLQALCNSREWHSCQNSKHTTWQASYMQCTGQDKNRTTILIPSNTSGVQSMGAWTRNDLRIGAWHFSQKRSHDNFLSTNTSKADIWPRPYFVWFQRPKPEGYVEVPWETTEK
jgi:hypothetical protein